MNPLGIVAMLLMALAFGRLLRLLARDSRDIFGIFADLFLGWHPDPWPRGVQEEDRDRPWGRSDPRTGKANDKSVERPLMPTLVSVQPTTRLR